MSEEISFTIFWTAIEGEGHHVSNEYYDLLQFLNLLTTRMFSEIDSQHEQNWLWSFLEHISNDHNMDRTHNF